jgi:hypothetical protein
MAEENCPDVPPSSTHPIANESAVGQLHFSSGEDQHLVQNDLKPAGPNAAEVDDDTNYPHNG